jgi:ATP-dependent RNA helicase DeaD
MSFSQLGLSKPLLEAIEALEFHTPTPVQAQAIPLVLENSRDLVVLARTGTGKTAAFGLPVLDLLDHKSSKTQALILAPTRELCLQITADMERFASRLPNIRITAVYGGAPITGQIRDLGKGAHIVVATPGRTIDLLSRGALHLDNVRFLVLDEADEMLTMGFKDELETILGQTPSERRTLLFSATMPPEIQRISGQYMTTPETLRTAHTKETQSLVTHQFARVAPKDRYLAIRRFVDVHPEVYGIIFCRTRRETQEVADWLGRDGYPAEALHGDLSQIQRDAVMIRFRRKQVRLLVATDVAARGIDVQELTHVIHYSLPDDTETYVHRSGRTGRAGNQGLSLCLVGRREERWIFQLQQKTGISFVQVLVPGAEDIRQAKLEEFIRKLTDETIDAPGVNEAVEQVLSSLKNVDKDEIIRRVLALEFTSLAQIFLDNRDYNDNEQRDDFHRNRRPHRGGHSEHPYRKRRDDRRDDRKGSGDRKYRDDRKPSESGKPYGNRGPKSHGPKSTGSKGPGGHGFGPKGSGKPGGKFGAKPLNSN